MVTSSRRQFLRCFRPLHALSGLFGLWPFVVDGTKPHLARWSILYALAIVTGYSVFHLYINYSDSYGVAAGDSSPTDEPQSAEVNFVSMIIDIYNRYSGLVLFWLLHGLALASRQPFAAIVTGVLVIDEQIARRLCLTPDHPRWCRFVCLQVAFTFLAIGFSEWYNCIMYMSDFIPASEYCIFQCYITMLTSSTVEIQYMGFVSLIKNRLQLINELLVELTEYGTEEEQSRFDRFRPVSLSTTEFLGEISSAHSQQPLAARPSDNPRTRARPLTEDPNRDGPSIPRGDWQWHKIMRQQQHKIITVNQAPPPRPQQIRAHDQAHTPTGKGDGTGVDGVVPGQFPLLVASLMHSQSKACEHIRMKIINDIKNVYTHLHLLSLNINKAYGAQLIFILMTLFVTLTTLLYYCTMKLFRMLWLGQRASYSDLITTFWKVFSTLSWACISTFRILRICSVCNSAKNEAQKIGSLVHGLGWKTHCTDTRSLVRILSLQLQQQRIEFTAGGLFTIDHGLMFNIVGSLATYLLILIQFDIAQNGAKWKSDPAPSTDSLLARELQ
ncbi:gustatory receptor for bitter taste 66a-like [Anopheles nili]|uniref:gustatory receptor for bitter taste 66a-like n=1 Tax=Anopheles nili TaxID=185578 RepID=UPI00237C3362|nr:gustatory receptor for bitter taste 66a-like [Anopheles nili]